MSVSHAPESLSLAAPEPGEMPDAGLAGVRKLVAMLSEVSDPRKPRGLRHRIGTVLAVTVFAVLAGATNFREAGDRAHLTTERGGAYALTVKGNQPTLLGQIAARLPAAVPGTENHVEEDRSKGRIVRRSIWVAPADGVDFPGVAQEFQIRRDTYDHQGNHLTKEIVHGVTSLPPSRPHPR